jgi:hypothetical protein
VNTDWYPFAACRGMPLAPFFPADRGLDPRAKAACLACTVRVECEETREATSSLGTWAGVGELARQTATRREQKQRRRAEVVR